MTTDSIPHRPHGRRAVAAAVVATLLMTLLAAMGASPTAAEDAPDAGLTWRISEQAFTNTSLAQAHSTTPPATKGDDAFSFPEVAWANYDPATQAASLALPGSLELGNTNRGNYRIRIGEPILTLDGDGTGDLSALVSYALPPEGDDDHAYTEPVRVVVANLTLPDGTITDTGSQVSFTVTPDFELVPEGTDGHRQFPQTFLDALDSSLQGHFRQTGSAADADKAPAPLTVSFPYGPRAEGLTWTMSAQAFTNTSLAQAHSTTPPATKGDDGFSFPEAASVDFDPATGAGEIAYPGGYELGNTNRGNYRIRVAEPILTLDGDGTGDLSALVSYALPPEGDDDHAYTEPVRVVVANLTLPAGAPSVIGTNVSFVVVPDFELVPEGTNGHRQFPQTFLDALDSSLQGHFRQTGAAADVDKAPAPLTVSFDLEPPMGPDEVFVHQAYDVVLGRSADEPGLDYWLARLEGGASRTALVTVMAASPEAQQRVVTLAYRLVLDRPADASGRAFWTSRMLAGLTAEQLVASLLTSNEAIDHRAGNDPDSWTELLFEIYLGRASDSGGFAYWNPLVSDVESLSHLRNLALRFGRTPEAAAHGTRTAISEACSGPTGSADQRTAVNDAWVRSSHHPLHTAGIALATICPETILR